MQPSAVASWLHDQKQLTADLRTQCSPLRPLPARSKRSSLLEYISRRHLFNRQVAHNEPNPTFSLLGSYFKNPGLHVHTLCKKQNKKCRFPFVMAFHIPDVEAREFATVFCTRLKDKLNEASDLHTMGMPIKVYGATHLLDKKLYVYCNLPVDFMRLVILWTNVVNPCLQQAAAVFTSKSCYQTCPDIYTPDASLPTPGHASLLLLFNDGQTVRDPSLPVPMAWMEAALRQVFVDTIPLAKADMHLFARLRLPSLGAFCMLNQYAQVPFKAFIRCYLKWQKDADGTDPPRECRLKEEHKQQAQKKAEQLLRGLQPVSADELSRRLEECREAMCLFKRAEHQETDRTLIKFLNMCLQHLHSALVRHSKLNNVRRRKARNLVPVIFRTKKKQLVCLLLAKPMSIANVPVLVLSLKKPPQAWMPERNNHMGAPCMSLVTLSTFEESNRATHFKNYEALVLPNRKNTMDSALAANLFFSMLMGVAAQDLCEMDQMVLKAYQPPQRQKKHKVIGSRSPQARKRSRLCPPPQKKK